MIIYKVTNKVNGKIYIGQTTLDIKKRWKGHLNDCKRAKNNKFYNAIKKYGEENFCIEIIEDGIEDIETLNAREKYWIKYFNSYKTGYNSTLGGEESPMNYKDVRIKLSNALKGRVKSEETKEKLRIAHLGKPGSPHTEEHKRYMSNLMKNRVTSEETKEKLRKINTGKKQSRETALKRSNAMKGRKFTEEHKQKISEALKGNSHVMTGREHPRSKQVVQINLLTGEIIKVYDSVCLAQKEMNGNPNGGLVYMAATGKRKTAYGYKWMFLSPVIELRGEQDASSSL